MIQLRRSEERGHANHGWLNAYHSFSFSDYHDPKFMGFRTLRVINEDRVAPNTGFPTHGHRDMEILTYVLEGMLEHKDSLGTGSIIRPGDVQRMSAGTGVQHSEVNASKQDTLHLLQIWILPKKEGLKPEYEQKHFSREDKHNQLRLLASEHGKEGSLTIHQDVAVYASCLDAGKALAHTVTLGRSGWLQVARGVIELNGTKLNAGDGAALIVEEKMNIRALKDAEFVFFDLD